MADVFSSKQRSYVMSRISGKDTKPELIVRAMLHRAGYRFKVDDKTLPGRPDIVLPKYGTVVFVHGCFWHRHKNCKHASMPKSNRAYWRSKFARNQEKDARAKRQLNALGWSFITLWECQITKCPQAALNRIINKLEQTSGYCYLLEEEPEEVLKAAEKKWQYLKR